MNYEIIENFLPKPLWNNYNNFFFRDEEMLFHYRGSVADKDDTTAFYFNRLLQAFNQIYDPIYFKLAVPLLYHGNIFNPQRSIVNCYIKQSTPIKTGIHTDHSFDHKVLLYAINTNNGYTVLDPKGKNIKLPSIANQAVIFDGGIEHMAVTQTDENVRININITFTPT